MRFAETPIPSSFIIDIVPLSDERGFFARAVCIEEFERHGLNSRFVQQSVSWNPRRGTLRGLHFQASPWEEEKLVRVTRGAVFDVVVDLRSTLPTFGRWFGVELAADNHRQIYIPKGAAHGFQTLTDDTEVLYEMTVPFHPEAARGIRWDDPELGITWPDAAAARGLGLMSSKDTMLPSFSELRSQFKAAARDNRG